MRTAGRVGWVCVLAGLWLGACADKASLGVYGGSSSGTATSSATTTGTTTGGSGSSTDTTRGSGETGSTETGTSESMDIRLDMPGAESSTGEHELLLDLGVPLEPMCDGAEVVELEISTPSGSMQAAHARWGWDACCYPKPLLVVVEADELEFGRYGVSNSPRLELFARSQDPPDTWWGNYEAVLSSWGDGVSSLEDVGFTVTEPLTYVEDEVETAVLGAIIDIEYGGWSIHGHVCAPHDVALDEPACGCE